MEFLKFIVENAGASSSVSKESQILLNVEHIVSIKPIKMKDTHEQIIDGYWIRLTNGKKYKALQVPEEIKIAFGLKVAARQISNLDLMEEILQ